MTSRARSHSQASGGYCLFQASMRRPVIFSKTMRKWGATVSGNRFTQRFDPPYPRP